MTKKYSILDKKKYIYNEYSLTPVHKQHIEKIRIWRNHQIDGLRQEKIISRNDQVSYFEKYVWNELDSKSPNQILFAFFLKEKLIGYGGLVHICWEDRVAELSFLLSNNRILNEIQYRKDLINFLSILKIVVHRNLKLDKIVTETYTTRKINIDILEESGFIVDHKKISINQNSKFHYLDVERL